MSQPKKVKCPFCGGTMTPVYDGDVRRKVVHSWECNRSSCQFNEEYFGFNGLLHRNFKKLRRMQEELANVKMELMKLKAQEEK